MAAHIARERISIVTECISIERERISSIPDLWGPVIGLVCKVGGV